MSVQPVNVGSVSVGPGRPLALIAGPCVIESREHTLHLAEAIARIAQRAELPLIFKASFDKANRSSLSSFRGPGLEAGIAILQEVRDAVGVPVTCDVHEPTQAAEVAAHVDLLQIPAFLCRQTDLLIAAARTARPMNIKKGQFISPEEMRLAVEKARQSGAGGVLLTERGTFFGYGRLVNDMTAIRRMAAYAPVVFDATHSCQLPGQGFLVPQITMDIGTACGPQAGTQSGGQREMVPVLARAGIAAGADALFLEVHDNPAAAKSDPATVWPLDQLAALLESCLRVAHAVRS